jgi:hypothetical protein
MAIISQVSAFETIQAMFPRWLEAKNNNDDKKRRQIAAVCIALLPWIFSGKSNLAKFYNENQPQAEFIIKSTYFDSSPLVFDMMDEYNLMQKPDYSL